MVLVTRRYRYTTAANATLQRLVAASAGVVAQYVNSVDVQVDNAVAGTTDALDEYLGTLGLIYAPTDPAKTTSDLGIGHWPWWISTAANNSLPMNCHANGSFIDLIFPRNGYLLSMASYLTGDLTGGGVITFQPRKGTPTTNFTAANNIVGAQWTMDDISFPRGRVINYAQGLYQFSAGEKFELQITLNGNAFPGGGVVQTVQMEVAYL